MRPDQQETAETFVRRKEKNLEFFKRKFPGIYQKYGHLLMKRVELVLSPVEADVDLQVEGRSLYHGKGKSYGRREAERFLAENAPGRRLKTVRPPTAEGFTYPRLASRSIRSCIESFPLREEVFEGYRVENFFPFIVFLGCGLGYQIEALAEKSEIVNALVFEPDEEIFSASLFTVDWQAICERFLNRKGYEIRFAIGVDATRESLKDVLEYNLNRSVPLYPSTAILFNHRGSGINRSLMEEVREDLPTLFGSWGNYDDEMKRLNNTAFNLRSDPMFIRNDSMGPLHKPVIIAGSGPSIDDRLDLIKQCRNHITLVSAGTGLKALLNNGVKPDFHVELDPDYLIYQLLDEIGKQHLHGITLITVNEVNSLVPGLFDEVYFYAKKDNPVPKGFRLERYAFDHCNPTCTNAAMAIFQKLGFRNFFLFGTDYGFKDRRRHHASDSVYGSRNEESGVSVLLNDLAQKNFIEGNLIEVDSVSGGKVWTRPDYFTAMRSVENLLSKAREDDPALVVWNCADGAEISGAPWLSPDGFTEEINRMLIAASDELEPRAAIARAVERHQDCELENRLKNCGNSLKHRVGQLNAVLESFSLGGKKDVVRMMSPLINATRIIEIPKGFASPHPEQIVAQHLLRGTLMHFMSVGLCHTMACDDDHEASVIAARWKKAMLKFLRAVPGHYNHIINDLTTGEGKRWQTLSIHDAESAVEN